MWGVREKISAGEVCPEEEVTSLLRGSLWTVNRPVNLVWVNPEKNGISILSLENRDHFYFTEEETEAQSRAAELISWGPEVQT